MGPNCGAPQQPRHSYQNRELYHLASLSHPTHVAELLADPSNLTPSVVHVSASALLARRPMSGKGSGGLCMSRHRALRAGAETVLLLGTVSAHFDLISWVVGMKTKSDVSWLSVVWVVLVLLLFALPTSYTVVTRTPLHLLHDFLYELLSSRLSYFSFRSLCSTARFVRPIDDGTIWWIGRQPQRSHGREARRT